MTQSLHLRLAALEAKATKGPWNWRLSLQSKQVYLEGSPGRGRETVMDFVRWGMSGAQPRFRNAECLMVPVSELSAIVPGREHHESWHRDVDHPDAALIVAHRNASPAILRILAAAEALSEFTADIQTLSTRMSELGDAVRASREVSL